MRQPTLKFKLPIGYTFATALIQFILLFGVGEAIARTDSFQSKFVAPGLGSRHRQFEIQLERLRRIVKQEGGIDCIFLGNSMVWRGFNPLAFAQAYRDRTGKDLRCFNFGIDGITTASAGPLAEILVKEYHPKLLIYGTDARDFAIPRDALDTSVILDSAWVRYRLGHFSLEGWLYENSYLYRYRRPLRDFMHFNYHQSLVSWRRDTHRASPYGFDPDATVGAYVNTPPDPEDERGPVQYYFKVLSNYQILPENLSGLQHLVNQNENGVQVLVVEMPIPPTYLYFFKNREQDYRKFRQQIGEFLETEKVRFFPMESSLVIPDDGWVDYSHLNTNGARIFSEWLGGKLGEAVALSSLANPVD